MSARRAAGLGAAFALTTFLILLLTAGDVGVTWDEPIYSEAAERAAHWLSMMTRGESQTAWDARTFGISWGLVNEHPPLVRVLSGLGWALTRGVLPPPTSHRVGALALAALALGVLVAVTIRKRGLSAGLFAGAAVLTMPRLFFHAHLAALDFPLAAVWMLATWAFYGAMQSPRWWSPFLVGGGLGLALLTKINAVLLIPFWGLWLLIYRRSWRSWLAYLLGLPVDLAVLIAGWPWIWKDPLGGLVNWVQFFRVHFEIRQWYAGQLYIQTPWYLPLAMVAITTPVALLVLATVGVFHQSKSQMANGKPVLSGNQGLHAEGTQMANRKSQIANRKSRPVIRRLPSATPDWVGLHLLGLLTVLGYYMLPITAIHDQERLLLPAFLHLAVLAGEGFAALWAWLEDRLGPIRRTKNVNPDVQRAFRFTFYISRFRHRAVGFGLAGLLLLPGILGIARLHPFELSYYNELEGGVAGAARRGMETTYFASTYGYFLPYLNALPAGSKLWVMPNSWDVIYYYQLNGLLRADTVLLRPAGWGSSYDDRGVLSGEGGLENADYALIDRRQTTFNDTIPEYAIQLEWAASKPEVARLEREGVLLAAFYCR